MDYLDEARLELVAVGYLRDIGYEYTHGLAIAPDGDAPARSWRRRQKSGGGGI